MIAASLLSLQQIDSALDSIANRRPRLPEAAAHTEAVAALTALRKQMAAAQQRIDTAQASIQSAEQAAHELTTKRTRLEGQLKTVIAPREAEALMHQIATINEQRSALDDQELAALDEQADAEFALATLAEEEPALVAAVEGAKAALDEVHAQLEAEASDLQSRRSAAVGELSAEQEALYGRVRKQFHGVGVSKLEGSHCSGCHMDLSPAELDIVKAVPADALAECPQCGRIMVR